MRHSSHIATQTAAAATISGHLFRASVIARQMALAAKNSRAMVLRAGSKAAGLKVISDFFDELADKTIGLSKAINQCAIGISQNSVRQWRVQTFIDRLGRTVPQVSTGKQKKLRVTMDDANHTMTELQGTLLHQLRTLRDQLDSIHHFMQASNVVAVTFRLEATQTGEFQPLLLHMAENIDGLSNRIKFHINTSQSQLAQFRE